MSDKNKDVAYVRFVNYDHNAQSNAFDQEDGPFYWTSSINSTDSKVVGPFASANDCEEAALGADPPEAVDRGDMDLAIDKLVVENDVFIKVMKRTDAPNGSEEYYVVFFAVSEAEAVGQQLAGPYDTIDECMKQAQKQNSFKHALLNKCQDEFDKADIYEDWKVDMSSFEEKKAEMTDKDKADTEEELEFRRAKIKKQMLGNVRFIGELYKKSMLKESVMHHCIKKLMQVEYIKETNQMEDLRPVEEIDEEDHESLGKLFSTIGSVLDNKKSEKQVNLYFQKIKRMSSDTSINSRIRFMYQDLIELRQNRWVTRRKEETMKTTAHAEASSIQPLITAVKVMVDRDAMRKAHANSMQTVLACVVGIADASGMR